MKEQEPNREIGPADFRFGDVVKIRVEGRDPFRAIVVGKANEELMTVNLVTDTEDTRIGLGGSQPPQRLQRTDEEPWSLERTVKATVANLSDVVSDETLLKAHADALLKEFENGRQSFEDPHTDS